MDIQRIYLLYQTSRLRSTGQVARIGEEIKYNGVDNRPEGKRTCGRRKCRMKTNVAQKAAN